MSYPSRYLACGLVAFVGGIACVVTTDSDDDATSSNPEAGTSGDRDDPAGPSDRDDSEAGAADDDGPAYDTDDDGEDDDGETDDGPSDDGAADDGDDMDDASEDDALADAGTDDSPDASTNDDSASDDSAGADAGDDDSAGDDSSEPDPTFNIVEPLAVGTEGVIVGGAAAGSLIPGKSFAMDEGYHVSSFARSRDGSVIWFTLYDEFAEEGLWWQVWSIDVDGGNAQRSSLTLPENWGYPGGFELAVSEDGHAAFLIVPIGVPAAVQPIRELQIFRASERGGAFTQVGTTEDVTEFDSLGLAQPVYPRATADGTSLIVNGGRGIWKFSQGDGWLPFKIGDQSEVYFDGEAPTASRAMAGLDIDAAGAKWITSVVFSEPDTMWAVLTGTSIPLTTIEEIRPEQAHTRLELDDSGQTVAYTFYGETLGDSTSIVGEQGGVQRVLTADVDAVSDVALSGDGQWIHAVNKPTSFETTHTSFFERVEDGSGRIKAHSEAFGGNGIEGGQLGFDGSSLVARVNVGDSIIGTSGLWSMFKGEMGRDGYPTVERIAYRFDEEDNLVVRVDAAASDTITEVYVLPLYERYVDPIVPLPSSDDNPLYHVRFGSGLVPLEDSPDSYEATLDVNRELLDQRFTLRAVVVSGPNAGEGNKAAFADFAVE